MLVRLTFGPAILVVGALAALVGVAVPWATVGTGGQLNSLTGTPISVSVSAFQADSGFALGVIVFSILPILCAASLIFGQRWRRQLAAIATWSGLMAAACGYLAISRAQATTAPAGLVGDLASLAGLVQVNVGFGVWLAIGGGAVIVLGGMLAWAER